MGSDEGMGSQLYETLKGATAKDNFQRTLNRSAADHYLEVDFEEIAVVLPQARFGTTCCTGTKANAKWLPGAHLSRFECSNLRK